MTAGEGADLESQIAVGESYAVPKPASLWQKIRAKWDARKIRLDVEPATEVSVQPATFVTTQIDEEQVRRYAEMNQMAAENFVNGLRDNYRTLLPDAQHDYSNPTVWFEISDLNKLLDRWALPAVIVRDPKRSHYMLALSMPEIVEGRWQVLVYNPLTDHPSNQSGRTEYYYPLYNWNPNDKSRSLSYQLTENGLFCNNLTYQVIEADKYDLRLYGDKESAKSMSEAKRVRTQFTASDCGPLSIFAAAVRTAYREGRNAFKDSGRDTLLSDTGVNIRTREEVLNEVKQG